MMDRLAEGTRGVDAVIFLDRLARLDTYPEADLELLGLQDLANAARAARAEHAESLGRAAGMALDLEHFVDLGRHLGDSGAGDHGRWIRELLLIATLRPWLSKPRGFLADGALAKAMALVSARPEAFLAASMLAGDRRQNEYPDGLGEEAKELLSLLDELPLLVLFDRSAESGSQLRVLEALAIAGVDAIEAAEDAIADHVKRADLRIPRQAGQLRFAAATGVGFVVCRMEAGTWQVISAAGHTVLHWTPDTGEHGRPMVQVLTDTTWRILEGDPVTGFPLPTVTEPLRVRLTVGSDSREVDLRPSDE